MSESSISYHWGGYVYSVAEPWPAIIGIIWLALGLLKAVEIAGFAVWLVRRKLIGTRP